MHSSYFILFFICFGFKLRAQQMITVKGVTYIYPGTERAAQVLITDLRTKATIACNQVGSFTINTAIGDTLLFHKTNFTDQKIAITGPKDIIVYMQGVVKLEEVTVKGQTKRQELKEVMGQYRSEGTFYDGKPPLLSFLSSPITGFYELFGKTPNEAKRFAIYSKQELEHAEVERRYTLDLVKRVTSTPDTTAKKFMNYYTPSFEDLKEWDDYELIRRVKKAYQYYNKNGDKGRLQQINAPSFLKSTKDTVKLGRD